MVDNTFSYGDVVQVTGTSTQLAPQRLVRRPEHPPWPLAPRKHHLLTVTPVKDSRESCCGDADVMSATRPRDPASSCPSIPYCCRQSQQLIDGR